MKIYNCSTQQSIRRLLGLQFNLNKTIVNPIANLNKAFENRSRLGIMSVLMVNDWIDFNALKELLDLTDGNLSSHISALEELVYIEIKKEFVGKKPKTSYRATLSGREAFNNHLEALENLINFNK